MTSSQPKPRAAIYARESLDAVGEGLAVGRQIEDCERLCSSQGYEIVGRYVDNDIGASRHSKTKYRPGYQAMIESVKTYKTDVIVAYSNSRLTRKPKDVEALIDLHDETGVQINTVVSGNDDLSTSDGRMFARMKASMDASEADRNSERRRRANRQKAQMGIPYGGGRYRAYGYTRDWEVIAEEAEVLREAYQRRASGESTNSIALDFNTRGLLTSSGSAWSQGTLSRVLERPLYAGLPTDVVEVEASGPDGSRRKVKKRVILDGVEPQWQAIVDRDLWEQVNNHIASDKRPSGGRKYLLSGFLTCNLCHGPMKGSGGGSSSPFYLCGCGRTTIRVDWADRIVTEVAHWHQRADRRTPNAPPSGRDIEAELKQIDADEQEANALRDSGDLPLRAYAAETKRLESRRRELHRLRAKEAAATRPAWWIEQRLGWEQMNLSQRRVYIAEAIESVTVDSLTTGPDGKRRKVARRGTLARAAGRFTVVRSDGEVVKPSIHLDADLLLPGGQPVPSLILSDGQGTRLPNGLIRLEQMDPVGAGTVGGLSVDLGDGRVLFSG